MQKYSFCPHPVHILPSSARDKVVLCCSNLLHSRLYLSSVAKPGLFSLLPTPRYIIQLERAFFFPIVGSGAWTYLPSIKPHTCVNSTHALMVSLEHLSGNKFHVKSHHSFHFICIQFPFHLITCILSRFFRWWSLSSAWMSSQADRRELHLRGLLWQVFIMSCLKGMEMFCFMSVRDVLPYIWFDYKFLYPHINV